MRNELLALLTEHSFARREVILASGRRSNFYIDCKQTTLMGRGHVLIGELMLERITRFEARSGAQIQAVGGLTLGADPLASAISHTASLKGRELPAYIVRKSPKAHGTERYIEGVTKLPEDSEVVVLEDVVTTGGSAITALGRVRDAGFKVPLVLGLVDRMEGGREAIEAEGVELICLYERGDFGVEAAD